MVAIGVGLIFGAYAVGMYGYCLVRGYDVSFRDLFRGSWQGAQSQAPSKAVQQARTITPTGQVDTIGGHT